METLALIDKNISYLGDSCFRCDSESTCRITLLKRFNQDEKEGYALPPIVDACDLCQRELPVGEIDPDSPDKIVFTPHETDHDFLREYFNTRHPSAERIAMDIASGWIKIYFISKRVVAVAMVIRSGKFCGSWLYYITPIEPGNTNNTNRQLTRHFTFQEGYNELSPFFDNGMAALTDSIVAVIFPLPSLSDRGEKEIKK
jgi:hypothetical protein